MAQSVHVELALWTPHVRAGYPLHANGEAGLLLPLEAPLRLLLSPHRATDAALVLSSLIGALLPRALLVSDARVLAGPAEAQAALGSSADPRRVVLLEPAGAAEPSPASFDPRPARIVARSANRVEIDVDAPEPGWLVLFEAWDAGWRAHTGSERLTVRRANGLFRAVGVPAGHQRIVFTYQPTGFVTGIVMAVAGVALLVSLGWFPRRSTPRHRETDSDAILPTLSGSGARHTG